MKQLTVVAVALWLGAMGFFAFVVAPAAFSTLEREAAGKFVSAVFPRYYAVGLALGLAALAGLGARWTGGAWRGWDWLPLGLVLLMLALTLYAGAVVLPAAHAAREAIRQAGMDPSAAAGFARLHRLSGILNAIVMVSGVLVLVVEMGRRRCGSSSRSASTTWCSASATRRRPAASTPRSWAAPWITSTSGSPCSSCASASI